MVKVNRTISFENDDIERYYELYPDKTFSSTIRRLLSDFLTVGDTDYDVRQKLEEERLSHEYKIKQINFKLRSIDALGIKTKEDEDRHNRRVAFLDDNQNIVESFQKHTISTQGYDYIKKELEFDTVNEIKQYIRGYIVTYDGVPLVKELKIKDPVEARTEYIKNHPEVLDAYKKQLVSQIAYSKFKDWFAFKNINEVKEWLDDELAKRTANE